MTYCIMMGKYYKAEIMADNAILTPLTQISYPQSFNNSAGIYSLNPVMRQSPGKWVIDLNRYIIVKVCHRINRGSLKFSRTLSEKDRNLIRK